MVAMVEKLIVMVAMATTIHYMLYCKIVCLKQISWQQSENNVIESMVVL